MAFEAKSHLHHSGSTAYGTIVADPPWEMARGTEFVLYARRGKSGIEGQIDRQWWTWPRGEHSAKPEAFLDMVEAKFPAPRLEMFARRARFGWDYYGDQSLGTAEVAA